MLFRRVFAIGFCYNSTPHHNLPDAFDQYVRQHTERHYGILDTSWISSSAIGRLSRKAIMKALIVLFIVLLFSGAFRKSETSKRNDSTLDSNEDMDQNGVNDYYDDHS